jgi:ABC-type phosphate/phosphonate transport system substrate-binding protein
MFRNNLNIALKHGNNFIHTYVYNLIIIFSIIFLTTSNIYSQSKANTDKLEVYGIAFLKTMFLNVDYNDAKASIKVYVDNLQDQLITGFLMKPIMFEDSDDLIKNYAKENLAVITLSSIDFLANKTKLSLNPVLVSSGKVDPLETYLILIKNDDNIKDIADLVGKKIGMLPKGNDPIPQMWLNVLLGNSKIVAKDKLFSSVTIDKTESQLILSLFFGQINSCLVSKTAFETMVEINPQIGNRLKVLKSSPRYLKAVSSFTNKFRKSKFSDGLLKHLTSLDAYPSGKQLFTLTKTAKIILYKEEYLDNVKVLISDYNKLPKRWLK